IVDPEDVQNPRPLPYSVSRHRGEGASSLPNYWQVLASTFLIDTRKERGTMTLEGLFSGLEAQSEITDLLDMLYGSYGGRLIAYLQDSELKEVLGLQYRG